MALPRQINNEKYYRDHFLSAAQGEVEIYDRIFNGISSYKSSILLPRIPEESRLKFIYQAVGYDNPQFFDYSFCSPYRLVNNSLQLMGYLAKVDSTSIEEIATSLLKEAVGLPPYARAVLISDYLELHATYDDDTAEIPSSDFDALKDHDHSFTSYGPLVDHLGVCLGLSTAFSYLCFVLDVPCIIIGAQGQIDHSFNAIQINGEWTNVDMTLTVRRSECLYHDRGRTIRPCLRLGFGLPDSEFALYGLSSNEFCGVPDDHLNFWVRASAKFTTIPQLRTYILNLSACHHCLVLPYQGNKPINEAFQATYDLISRHGISVEQAFFCNYRYLCFLGGDLYEPQN
jgi:hypothetical protein